MTSHNTIRTAVRKYLSSLPQCRTITYSPAGYGEAGVADILVCYRGRFIAVEIKRAVTSDKPSALQLAFGRSIEKAGGSYHVVRSADDMRRVIAVYDELTI